MKRILLQFACAAGLALAPLAHMTASAQDRPAKTVDVKIRVAVQGGDTLPSDTKVEISDQEEACGELNDPRRALDSKGEAMFLKLPLCRISIKVLLKGYIQAGIEMNGKKLEGREVDLRQYADLLCITMQKEH